MSQLSPKRDNAWQYAQNCVAQGISRRGIKEGLRDDGILEEEIDLIIAACREAHQKEAKDNLTEGFFWLGGGLAVTVITMVSFAQGGVWIIAYGAILVGGTQFFRGLRQFRRHRAWLRVDAQARGKEDRFGGNRQPATMLRGAATGAAMTGDETD